MSIGSSIVSAGIRASLKIAARRGSRAPFDPYSIAPSGRGAMGSVFQAEGRDFQIARKEIPRKGKRNPNFLLPLFQAFQRLKLRIQETKLLRQRARGPASNSGPIIPQHKLPFGLSQRIVEYFRGDAASCATSAEPGASRTTSAARIAASFRLSLRCRAT
jgi:hypothetical protein